MKNEENGPIDAQESESFEELKSAIQKEGIGLADLIIAGVLGSLVWIVLAAWEFPGLQPVVWHDIAVATDVRPADTLIPGFYTFIADICHSFGVGAGGRALKFLGHLSAACLAILIYALLRELLAFIMRARPQHSKRRTIVMRMAATMGSLAFVSSDPVWSAGQCLSANTILIGLTLLGIEAFFLFLRKGALKYAYLCALAMGLLAAETPLAFLLVLLFIALNEIVLTKLPVFNSPFFKPEVIAVGKWYMTFIFAVAFVIGVLLNCYTFVSHGGLEAAGKTIGDLPLDYLLGYWSRISHAAGPVGWALWVGIAVMPFVVSTVMFPKAADEDEFLAYSTGVVFIVCSLVAYMQSCCLPALWFWQYGEVDSQYLLAMGLLLCSTTLTGGICILGVDALCRDHKRLAHQTYGMEDADDMAEGRIARLLRPIIIACVPVVILAGILPGRTKQTTRAMMEVIRDAVQETVREADTARFLFTDGNLDTAVELEASRCGRRIYCLSLMALDKNAIFLRTRGMETAEDKFSFGHDAGMGLRSWIRDQPEKLEHCGVQMAFDLWKRDGKALPPMGGMMSRPAGFMSPAEQARSVAAAHELAERVLGIYARGGIKSCTDKLIKNAFLSVQWRLARMCIYRGEVADLRGDAETAIKEVELAKALNDRNETYQALVSSMVKRNEQMLSRITPREGLQLSLVRADFTMGKLYAETILAGNPDNADANFAMGMYYLQERQLTRAEEYLKRCLMRKPNEPAIYNNLAMLQMEIGKLDAARKNVEKALKLMPDSAAIQNTRKLVDEAIAARDEKLK